MSVTEPQMLPAMTSGRQPLKLIDALNIARTAPQQGVRRFNIFFACGFTPLHLKTFLAAHLQLLCPDRRIAVQTGFYGDAIGNLERAAKASPDAVAIVLEWPDLDPRLGIRAVGHLTPSAEETGDSVCEHLQRIQQIIDEQLADTMVALSLPTIGPRAFSTQPGWTANALDAVLLKCVADFTVWASTKKHVRVVSSQRLDELSPPHTRWDIRSDLTAGFPYQLTHASILADLLGRLIRPPVPKKGLITDLDDTLWSGIVGDVGVNAISWNLDRHSQPHALYQQQLRTMAKAGVLVAVASKNDPAIVLQAFDRPDLLMDVKQVFPIEVSWGAKSAAVRRILNAWNVGPDSVVFVDDSPMELAEVQAAFPEIECLLFPKNDPKACIDLLDRLRDTFGKYGISEEDTLRLNSLRSQATSQATWTKDFLQEAEAEITFSAAKDVSDPRPLELINKTNQFNLNGRRFTESEWLQYLRDPQSYVFVISYKDKYGELGKVAVLGCRTDRSALLVDVWVMSCRAFSRRIEHQCLRQLLNKYGVSELSFDFQPTSRNTPLQEFFADLLDERPESPFVLSRAAFEAKCPQLFHTLQDA